jgi:hypothetical protein
MWRGDAKRLSGILLAVVLLGRLCVQLLDVLDEYHVVIDRQFRLKGKVLDGHRSDDAFRIALFFEC